MTNGLLIALITGFVGSFHCIAMCGPLVGALPVGRLPQAQRPWAVALYHAGRLTTYAGLGAGAGALGGGLHWLGWQRPLAVGVGATLLIVTLLRYQGRSKWPVSWLQRRLAHTGLAGFVGLGILNGLLPCATTSVALAGAVVMPSAVSGATYLLAFGLGTLPALLGARWFVRQAGFLIRRYGTRSVLVLKIAVGLLLIGRGIQPQLFSHVPEHTPIPICVGRSLP